MTCLEDLFGRLAGELSNKLRLWLFRVWANADIFLTTGATRSVFFCDRRGQIHINNIGNGGQPGKHIGEFLPQIGSTRLKLSAGISWIRYINSIRVLAKKNPRRPPRGLLNLLPPTLQRSALPCEFLGREGQAQV